MLIKFDTIPIGKQSVKTKRVYTKEVADSIVNQINITPIEIPILNVVGDHEEIDTSRICGYASRGTAQIHEDLIQFNAYFLPINFFLSHPYEWDPKMEGIDLHKGNIVEKLSILGCMEYSPIGYGEIEKKDGLTYVTNYELKYIYCQPRGVNA